MTAPTLVWSNLEGRVFGQATHGQVAVLREGPHRVDNGIPPHASLPALLHTLPNPAGTIKDGRTLYLPSCLLLLLQNCLTCLVVSPTLLSPFPCYSNRGVLDGRGDVKGHRISKRSWYAVNVSWSSSVVCLVFVCQNLYWSVGGILLRSFSLYHFVCLNQDCFLFRQLAPRCMLLFY